MYSREGCPGRLRLVADRSSSRSRTAALRRRTPPRCSPRWTTPSSLPSGIPATCLTASSFAPTTARSTRRADAHVFAPVGRPTGNAVAEHTLRTMKEECVWLEDWRNARDLRAALEAWRRSFNEVRPHQSLNWLTSAEYRSQRLDPAPERVAA